MKKIAVTITCDICEKDITGGNYRRETFRDPQTKNITEFHYCNDCFNANCEQCEVCQDHFVNIGWHNLDNRLGGARLV